MKKLLGVLKWTSIVLGLVILIVVVTVLSLYPPHYDAPQVQLSASSDSSVIAQGKYLVYGPAHCAECHIKADRKNIANLESDLLSKPLSGGLEFTLPGGVVYSGNLTPDNETGIGRYTDAELARIIRYCVKPNNELLFPFMAYSGVSDEDLTAIVSYLRSLEPVNSQMPEREIGFLIKGFSLMFFDKPMLLHDNIPKSVARDTTAAYGEYLSNSVSGCNSCHTKINEITGEPIGPLMAGGGRTPSVTEEPGVWVYTPNLTQDRETGRMYGWSVEQFIARFRAGRGVKESIMPWEAFKSYSDNDLKAVYMYLARNNT
jgi:mono/diheme cytochrome c family protein